MRSKFTYDELSNVSIEANNLEHHAGQVAFYLGALYQDTERQTTLTEIQDWLTHARNAAHRLDVLLADLGKLPTVYDVPSDPQDEFECEACQ